MSICSLPEPTKLKWNVDEMTNAALDEALAEINRPVLSFKKGDLFNTTQI